MVKGVFLTNRSLLTLSGDEIKEFLQGLITNDAKNIDAKHLLYSLMLTPQGKFLYDFFIFEDKDKIFIDCLKQDRDEIISKLNLYKLGKNIDITKDDSLDILFLDSEISGAYQDPRFPNAVFRAYISKQHCKDFLKLHDIVLEVDLYNAFLFGHTFPDSSQDMIKGKSFPLEYDIDKYNAISFKKGCYVGQELIARTKYRGVIRKKLYRVESEQDINAAKGDEVIVNGKSVGIFCSAYKRVGKILLRNDLLEKELENNTKIDAIISGLAVKIITHHYK